MSQKVNHIAQAVLTVLQGLNVSMVPLKFSKYAVLAISILQWIIANSASKSDPVTGTALVK